jgi:hypothetical protein
MRTIAMAANKPAQFATVDELEAELREYVKALSPDALSDELLPPPLAYSELSRNGRDDLALAVMENGGYIQFSRRLGLRWLLPKGPVKEPAIEVNNFDPTEALRSGFLKLGNARTATEDILETKKLSEFERREANAERARELKVGRGTLVSLIEPAQKPYVNLEDETPARQLLIDLQMTVPQRASAVLLAWTLAAAYGAHPMLTIDDATTLLALRAASGVWVAVQLGLGGYAALLAREQERNALVWFFKTTISGAIALDELRGETTRLPPADASDAQPPESAAPVDRPRSSAPPNL